MYAETYKKIHQLTYLPPPYVTSLTQTTTQNIPSKWLIDQSPKVKRTMEQIFTLPWLNYLDICTRTHTSHQMIKLEEEFFRAKQADDTTAMFDNEAPVDPKIMKDLTSLEVSKATKKLQRELTSLKKDKRLR